MIIDMHHIYKSYFSGGLETPALKDINFQVNEGEYVAVMGPSGSGKSTLMNIIGCLDKPTSGEMLIDGKDISKCTEDQMADIRLKEIGFIFQSFQLLSYENALENVCIPLSYEGVPLKERRKRAAEALARVGLEDRMHHLPNQLSGGQKQRVAIARAMINHPRILLADEPTGALDQTSGKQIMELFDELHKDGVSIVMITHDLNIAKRADHMVKIIDGRLYTGDEEA